MKTLPRWALIVISLSIAGAVVGTVAQFAEKSFIYAQGDIEITPELVGKARGVRTLFIVVYDVNNPAPMPYGAIRHPLDEDAVGKFHKFTITRDNLQVMRPSNHMPKLLRLKARLDVSGTAGMDSAGDLVGEIVPVKTGSEGILIRIDKVIEG